MLTAVTQVDGSGRQVRNFRQPSYYRSISTGSAYKENICLLQTSGQSLSSSPTAITVSVSTPKLTRKSSSSTKSPHPNQRAFVTSYAAENSTSSAHQHRIAVETIQQHHNHSTEIIQNDNSVNTVNGSSGINDRGDKICLNNGAVDTEDGNMSTVLSHNNNSLLGGAGSEKKFASASISGGRKENGRQPVLSGEDLSVVSTV